MNLKYELTHIDLSKKSLPFLAERIVALKYRGNHLVQHARHNVDDFILILKKIEEYATGGKLRIRTTDEKNRLDLDVEADYARFIGDIRGEKDKFTKDSVRKVIFPDMHRMGFIKRYGKKLNEIDPYKKQHVYYVEVTELGKKIVSFEHDLFQKNKLFTQTIDTLTKNEAQKLFDITVEEKLDSISVYEYMFFLSFIGNKLNGVLYTKEKIVELLKDYQHLTPQLKRKVVDTIKKYCEPSNFKGGKTKKKDFKNWKNEAESLFYLLDCTMYFSLNNKRNNQSIIVKIGSDGIFDSVKKLKRSQQEKDNYFKKHSITKHLGFELHHIVPLMMAKNSNDFTVLDRWQNMIYLNGTDHNIISQTGNKNIVLTFAGDDVKLSDFSSVKKLKDINAKFDSGVYYNVSNKNIMKKTNDDLLTSL